MSDKVTSVKVRMYNTGSVGDCILLLFMKGTAISFKMLIDCGGIHAPADTISACAQDISDICKKELDLLIVTHEHEDHISGFNLARSVFDKMTVKESWMSWVEDKNDPIAKDLKKKYGKKLKELRKITEEGLAQLRQQARFKSEVKGADKNLGFKQQNMQQALAAIDFEEGLSHGSRLAAGKRTNSDAMDFVKTKGKNMKYRLPGEVIKNIPGAEGIKFYILGPPRDKDLKFLKIEMQEDEIYQLALNTKATTDDGDVSETIFKSGITLKEGVSPFGHEYICRGADKTDFFKRYNSPAFRWRQIETDWQESGSQLSLALTRLINNTSLAMALEFESTEAVILLPADAQSGNWMSWHQPEVMKSLKDKGGKDTNELLANTVFYKVGHHGSHNGTASKMGLDLINNKNLVAFMPLVQDKVPSQWGGATNFPAKALNKVLIQKTKGKMVRTDEGLITDAAAKQVRAQLPVAELKNFQDNFKKGPCYYEFTVSA